MIRSVLLSLLLATAVFAQSNQTLVISDPFVLKPKPVTNPVVIALREPSVLDGGSVVVLSNTLTVTGTASSAGGVKRVDINGYVTAPTSRGEYTARIPLRNGPNRVTVNVETAANGSSAMSFTALCDTRAPVIEVLQPKGAGMRGIRKLVVDTTVLIARVSDDCMLNEVTVNGVPAQVGADSLITVQLSLRESPDTVRIAATDVGGHTSHWEMPMSLRPRSTSPDFLAGRTYGLVVGIDAYKGRWPRLKNAVNDARAVAQLLMSRFQFTRIDSLYNEQATRNNILAMIETVGRTLRPEDRLLIYYSGHGYKEPPYNKGYWVPADATDRSIGQYISNRDIQDYMAGMNPRHVLLIADACFAGDIFKGGALRYEFEENSNYYKRVAAVKSRKAMTSGGDEPVMDEGSPGHSIFAAYFIKTLSGMEKPYFSAWEVFERLRIAVANNSDQVPQFDAVKNTGDEGGEFLFVRR